MNITLFFEATSIAAFQVICVTLVITFIIFCCIPPLHSPVRRLVRPFIIHHVHRGIEWVIVAQTYQTSWLTKLFEQSSHSVSVPFYGSFLPGLMWLGLPELGWHLVILMTLSLTVGNAMKDLVSGPRPLGLKHNGYRVKHLGNSSEETEKNAKEYGFPSSHTMNSLCLNFYTCHYVHERGIINDTVASRFFFFIIIPLCCCILFLSSSCSSLEKMGENLLYSRTHSWRCSIRDWIGSRVLGVECDRVGWSGVEGFTTHAISFCCTLWQRNANDN